MTEILVVNKNAVNTVVQLVIKVKIILIRFIVKIVFVKNQMTEILVVINQLIVRVVGQILVHAHLIVVEGYKLELMI